MNGCLFYRFIFFTFTFFLSFRVFSFVHNISDKGEKFYWSSPSSMDICVDASNDQGLDENKIKNIVKYSIEQWNGKSHAHLNYNDASSSDCVSGRIKNKFLFDRTEYPFGRGVLGVTLIRYDPNTGRIKNANIFINDEVLFSDSIGGTRYFIGDVVTHELGHFWGLSHGQVHRSTMLFTVFEGQSSVHSDDEEGINTIYPQSTSQSQRGSIRGHISGSNSRIGVFGAFVQAVSLSEGRVVASVPTDRSGRFSLSSLPINDTYYLYISPLKKNVGLPEYYDDHIRADFCSGGKSWVGSYFQKCGRSEKGHPQGISLTRSRESVNLASVTIQCEFQNPNLSNFNNYEINMFQSNGSVGEAITGVFESEKIEFNDSVSILENSQRRSSHFYNVDLSQYAADSSKELYLEVKVTSQALYSLLRTNIIINRVDEEDGEVMYPRNWNEIYSITDEESFDSTNPLTESCLDHSREKTIRIPIKNNYDENIFTIEVVPQPLYGSLNAFFPSSQVFVDDSIGFYLMTLSISEKLSSGKYTIIEKKNHAPYGDNIACMDGPETFVDKKSNKKVEQKPLCGTTTLDDTQTGAGNILALLLGSLFIVFFHKIRRKKSGFWGSAK